MSSKNAKVIDEIVDNVLDLRSKDELKDVLWEAYEGRKCKKNCGQSLNIIVLNAPCYGFGDLIFSMKLAGYLREWYSAKVIIASPLADGLVKLGEKPENTVLLKAMSAKVDASACHRFQRLRLATEIPKQDLILVAPIQAGFNPSLRDVRYLIPYADVFNTFTFSEYNDSTNKGFDFNTGVGNKRYGLLLTNMSKIKGKPQKVKKPYALSYIASPENLPNADGCLLAFVEMIASKYRKSKRFEIVIPAWVANDEAEWLKKRIVKRISPYFSNIVYQGKEGKMVLYRGAEKKNTLTLRADVLPVPNQEMIRLMKGSVKDILITGDQSLTDALSCCSSKNIFYQIAPWKENLGKNLTHLMPNKYLQRKRTSCGTLEAVRYKSGYRRFVNKWDFRKLAKPKMDAIILSILAMKNDDVVKDLVEVILNSRTLSSIQKRVEEWDDKDE